MTPREIAERHARRWVDGGGVDNFDSFTSVIDHFAAACEEAAAEARRAALRPVEDLLVKNGCDCPCACDAEWHDDDCDRCLACRIASNIRARKEAE